MDVWHSRLRLLGFRFSVEVLHNGKIFYACIEATIFEMNKYILCLVDRKIKCIVASQQIIKMLFETDKFLVIEVMSVGVFGFCRNPVGEGRYCHMN